MKVPLVWLNDWVSIEDLSLSAVTEKLCGCGVEVCCFSEEPPLLSKAVCGIVISCNCRDGLALVSIGEVDPLTIDTFGMYLREHQRILVFFAKDVTNTSFLVSKGLDGVLAFWDEGDHPIPLLIPNSLSLGARLGYDWRTLDVYLTPDLFFCSGIKHLAIFLGNVKGFELKADAKSYLDFNLVPSVDRCKIDQAVDGCSFFSFTEVFVSSDVGTPIDIYVRLKLAGISIISPFENLVNFVSLDLGTRLTLFDSSAVFGSLVLTKPGNGEILELVGSSKITCVGDELIIADDSGPISLAGIAVASGYEVNKNTTNYLVELSDYSSELVEHAARIHNLVLSKHAAGKGTEAFVSEESIRKLYSLLLEHGLGSVLYHSRCGVIERSNKIVNFPINLPRRLLGVNFDEHKLIIILQELGFTVTKLDDNTLSCLVPSWRNDLNIAEDVVDEIVRKIGLDVIPRRKLLSPVFISQSDSRLQIRRSFRSKAVACGLMEVLHNDFMSSKDCERFSSLLPESMCAVSVRKPVNIDSCFMRYSMIPGLVSAVSRNINDGEFTWGMFEMGEVYTCVRDTIETSSLCAIAMGGEFNGGFWNPNDKRKMDMYDLLGIIRCLFGDALSFEPSNLSVFYDFQQAYIMHGEKKIGIVGEVHPLLLDDVENLFVAEFEYASLPVGRFAFYSPLPKFPGSYRDETFIVAAGFQFKHMKILIPKRKELYSWSLLSVFDKKEDRKRNFTIRFSYRSQTRTLEKEFINYVHSEIVAVIRCNLSTFSV